MRGTDQDRLPPLAANGQCRAHEEDGGSTRVCGTDRVEVRRREFTGRSDAVYQGGD
jgi:hypothetical protein